MTELVKTLSPYPESVLWSILWFFGGNFGAYLGGVVFPRKIGKIKRNKKYWRLSEVLKLEFVINN